MDLQETRYEDVDWIRLAQDSDQWRALVDMVINIWVSMKGREFLD
jgi:hypothetical protein